MLGKTNIEERLVSLRNKRISPEDLLAEVQLIFQNNEAEREAIKARISESSGEEPTQFTIDLLATERIFHRDDIKKLCVDYRLRFLDSHFFKGAIPEEAVSEIRKLEAQHDTEMLGMKVVAPAKLMKLENADDPLLFATLGNGYYYLIHKWGNDLHPFRKLLMWPYKNFENLVCTIFLVSLALTYITPIHLFTKGDVTNQEYLLMFLFMLKAVGGTVLFYGFAKGKNFNVAIWDSKYYNA